MNMLRFAFLGCLLTGLVGCGTPTTTSVRPGGGTTSGGQPAATGGETNKDKILGTWELVKSEEKAGPPPGTLVDFAKDGKLKITVKVEGNEMSMPGTYKVEGEKLTITTKDAQGKEKPETETITKMTDKEFVTKNEKGKTTEFKKK
jgi:uncharacterized protein (TIGR03066 family)